MGKRKTWIDLDSARVIRNSKLVLTRVEVGISSIVVGERVAGIERNCCLIVPEGEHVIVAACVDVRPVEMCGCEVLRVTDALLDIGGASAKLAIEVTNLIAIVGGTGTGERGSE